LKASFPVTNCDIYVLDTEDVAEVPPPQQINDYMVREDKWKQTLSNQFFSLPLDWALLVCHRFIKILKTTVLLTFKKKF